MADIISFSDATTKMNKDDSKELFEKEIVEVLELLIEDVKKGDIKGIALAITKSYDKEDLVISSSWMGLPNTTQSMYSTIKFLHHRFENEYFNMLIPQDDR